MTAVLRSTYHPDTALVDIELEADGELGDDARLALTSILQLTPPAGCGVRLVRRLGTYHEFAASPGSSRFPLRFGRLSVSRPARHAWDGPVSAFVILPDGGTSPIRTEPMQRAGGLDGSDPVEHDHTHDHQHTHDHERIAEDHDHTHDHGGAVGDHDRAVGEHDHTHDHDGAVGDHDGTVGHVHTDDDHVVDHERADRRVTGGDDRSTQRLPLVPHPAVVEVGEGHEIAHRSVTLTDAPTVARSVWRTVRALTHRTGRPRSFVDDGGFPVEASIDDRLRSDEYRLAIGATSVDVSAATGAGFRYAFVSLAQWLEVGLPQQARLEDAPTWEWRGLHIDLARQWFEPEVVARLIDEAAWRKLSRLHLHLTDDEGWRLPVPALPALAEVGGRRGHGLPLPPMLGDGAGPTGRAYTEREIAAWVDRADELRIVLVPEVDLPGHAHAALTALPGLRDPDDHSGATSVQHFTDNVIVPGHPETDRFLDDVVDAVCELFPSSPWIHIGGDEVPDDAWRGSPIVAELRRDAGPTSTREIEARFHRDLVARLAARGRRVGAWQEAGASGGVRPGDGYVVGWRTAAAGRHLAAAGLDVVVSPGAAYYLDMATDDEWTTRGASWAGATSLADVCAFVPGAGWSRGERERLLGVQACLWTEYVRDAALLEDALFPRLDAVAERAWTGRIVGGPDDLSRRSVRQRSPITIAQSS